MLTLDLEHARPALARGLARQAMDQAASDSANIPAILSDLWHMAPNQRSRARHAARLKGRRGVVRANTAPDGLIVTLRTVLTVDLQKDGAACFTEDRIAWTRIHLRNTKRMHSFQLSTLHATRHALQRRVERSDCPLSALLEDMDAAMLRAMTLLRRDEIISDREDDYLPARRGVWAGGTEETPADPNWGPAFHNAAPVRIFAIRTFLGEPQMRPTVWLGWSDATGADRAVVATA